MTGSIPVRGAQLRRRAWCPNGLQIRRTWFDSMTACPNHFAVKVLVDAHLRAKQEGRARLPLTAPLSSFAGAVRWLQPNGRGFESLRALQWSCPRLTSGPGGLVLNQEARVRISPGTPTCPRGLTERRLASNQVDGGSTPSAGANLVRARCCSSASDSIATMSPWFNG